MRRRATILLFTILLLGCDSASNDEDDDTDEELADMGGEQVDDGGIRDAASLGPAFEVPPPTISYSPGRAR